MKKPVVLKIIAFIVLAVILNSCTKEEEEEDFSGPSGTFVDTRDNTEYEWVSIGDQVWMAGNLAYLPSVSPSSEESYTDPYYYVYGYQGSKVSEAKAADNYDIYGVLYNWPAALNACPNGWHLPTDAEWKTLEMHLGMSQAEADQTEWRGTDEGGKLKEIGTSHWDSPNEGATNETGFTALPGGFRYDYGGFDHIGISGAWWSATEYNPSRALPRYVLYYYATVYRHYYLKESGFSVRCIKDQ